MTEPDEGENVTVSLCFSAELTEPLSRNASFTFYITNRTTAILGEHFLFSTDTPILTIPAYSDPCVFTFCTNITILGDNEFMSGDRRIIINVTALSPFDRVYFSNGTEFLVVTINENDGMFMLRTAGSVLELLHTPPELSVLDQILVIVKT